LFGGPLLTRTTHEVSLTELGERCVPLVHQIVAGFDNLVVDSAEDRSQVAGPIRVKVPSALALSFFDLVFCRFQQAHPKVYLQVVLADRSVNPVEEGYDLALTASQTSYEGVIDEALQPYRRILTAAPSYLARRGVPHHPDDLSRHDCMRLVQDAAGWSFKTPDGLLTVGPTQSFTSNSASILLSACLNGLGIALLWENLCKGALQSGLLVPVLPDFPTADRWVSAHVPAFRLQLPRVRALLDFIRAAVREHPDFDWSTTGEV
jgi:DNA-binding transcriptional LysR family regulator